MYCPTDPRLCRKHTLEDNIKKFEVKMHQSALVASRLCMHTEAVGSTAAVGSALPSSRGTLQLLLKTL